jgi:oligosaccharyltransferase complex subunit alpha (ribophorin I)
MWTLSRLRLYAVALLSLSSTLSLASATNATAKTLLDSFAVPPVFENSNLVRNINLERSYPRETINLVVKNIGSKPESEYYYLFPSDLVPNVSGLEVRDKRDPKAGLFLVELAQYASPR